MLSAGMTVDDAMTCPEGDVDPRWGITWSATEGGRRDTQPCPAIDGMETAGVASRLCGRNGKWEEEVEVINCRNVVFENLFNEAVSYNDQLLCKEGTICQSMFDPIHHHSFPLHVANADVK